MGLRQPVTIETESSGIEGGNLWRKILELKKGGGGGRRRRREEEEEGGKVRGYHTQCNKKP